MAADVDDSVGAVDELDAEEGTSGMPVGGELRLGADNVFCAKKDAVGVGTLSTTEPERNPSR